MSDRGGLPSTALHGRRPWQSSRQVAALPTFGKQQRQAQCAPLILLLCLPRLCHKALGGLEQVKYKEGAGWKEGRDFDPKREGVRAEATWAQPRPPPGKVPPSSCGPAVGSWAALSTRDQPARRLSQAAASATIRRRALACAPAARPTLSAAQGASTAPPSAPGPAEEAKKQGQETSRARA